MTKDYNLNVTPANQILRTKYACDDTWIRRFLLESHVGHVATRWETQPFITPVLFVYNEGQNEISFHTNIVGRIKANAESFPQACFEASRMGNIFPANTALEFSMQYESVVVFGNICVIEDPDEKRTALYALIAKYFPGMKPDQEYRPITEQELIRTAVLCIKIESWSGKRNWPEKAHQSSDWQMLDAKWLK
jgi:nitroimidazol reductase NimA-like FMN-containing flavoprotein (pyridoxamine 5'-phosphate oxidase superfamily)